jgi:hypothetical protein
MGTIIAFVVRLVGYGLVVGIPARIAQALWETMGLDHVAALQNPHDQAIRIAAILTVVIALFGYGVFRRAAIFLAFYLAGALFTAPFAFVRLATT